MRAFILIASIAFVAAVSQVSGDSGESSQDLQKILGITDKELDERQNLINITRDLSRSKTEIWGNLQAYQRERLRHAILLDKKPPAIWTELTSYDQIIKPEFHKFLWTLCHWEVKKRYQLFNALPTVPHENLLQKIHGKSWYMILNYETYELDRRILNSELVPEGYNSWEDAINDTEKFKQWIKDNKRKLKNLEDATDSAPVQKRLGITDEELKKRLDLLNQIEKLELWSVLTAVQQHRLRHAVLLDNRVPGGWTKFPSYDKIVAPENAEYLGELARLGSTGLETFMDMLEPVAHEDLVRAAEEQAWFKSLSVGEQKEKSTDILTGRNVPEGFESWKEAINSGKL